MAESEESFADSYRKLRDRTFRQTHPWMFYEPQLIPDPIAHDAALPLFPPGIRVLDCEDGPWWLIWSTVTARLFDVPGEGWNYERDYFRRIEMAPIPWRTAFTTFEVHSQILNGGISQMLDNRSDVLPMAIRDFSVAGLNDIASILRDAERVANGDSQRRESRTFSMLVRNMLGITGQGGNREEETDRRIDAIEDRYLEWYNPVDKIELAIKDYIVANMDAFTSVPPFPQSKR